MGGATSNFLTEEDYAQIHEETGFNNSQIRRLYSRFAHLDKGSKGYLTRQDLMLIPDLAVNPLGNRIIEVFFSDDSDPPISVDEVNFRQFVRILALFRKIRHNHPHDACTEEKKLNFVFRIYDEDQDGKISKKDLSHILSCLVGVNIPQEQINSIVRRTMREADLDKDDFISLSEFKAALAEIDVSDKMSFKFSIT